MGFQKPEKPCSKNILIKFESSKVQPISFVLCRHHSQREKILSDAVWNVVCCGRYCSVCYVFDQEEAKEHV